MEQTFFHCLSYFISVIYWYVDINTQIQFCAFISNYDMHIIQYFPIFEKKFININAQIQTLYVWILEKALIYIND